MLMEIKKFSVPELLLRLNKTYQSFAEQQNMRYLTRYNSPEVVWLQGDRAAIEQILSQVIERAFEVCDKENIELVVEYIDPELIVAIYYPGIEIESVKFKAEILLNDSAYPPEDLVQKWQMRDIEMSDLVELVLVSIAEKKTWMDAAVANHDVVELKELVHAAKGVTGNYHMEEFYDLFSKLDEYLVKNPKIDETVQHMVASLSEIINKIPLKYFKNNEV